MLPLAALMWAVALSAAVYSNTAAKDAFTRENIITAARDLMPRPIANSHGRFAGGLQKDRRRTPAAPNGVKIKPASTHIVVSATRPALYEAWMLAMNAVIGQAPQYRWQISSLCAGKQCPGRIFRPR